MKRILVGGFVVCVSFRRQSVINPVQTMECICLHCSEEQQTTDNNVALSLRVVLDFIIISTTYIAVVVRLLSF